LVSSARTWPSASINTAPAPADPGCRAPRRRIEDRLHRVRRTSSAKRFRSTVPADTIATNALALPHLHLAGKQRPRGGGPGRLGHELRALREEPQPVGDERVGDHDNVLDSRRTISSVFVPATGAARPSAMVVMVPRGRASRVQRHTHRRRPPVRSTPTMRMPFRLAATASATRR